MALEHIHIRCHCHCQNHAMTRVLYLIFVGVRLPVIDCSLLHTVEMRC